MGYRKTLKYVWRALPSPLNSMTTLPIAHPCLTYDQRITGFLFFTCSFISLFYVHLHLPACIIKPRCNNTRSALN